MSIGEGFDELVERSLAEVAQRLVRHLGNMQISASIAVLPIEPMALDSGSAAAALGISVNTLTTLPIPSVRIGTRRLYRPEALRSYLDKLQNTEEC